MRPLRDHQVEALDLLRSSLAGGKLSPMFAAPTGFGKTRVMAEIALRAVAKGKRVLITVPALSLVDQTVTALREEGVDDIGVIQGIHELTNSAATVQVASVQTLQKRRLPACDVILVDEAHRWFQFYESMIVEARSRRCPVIGLSATPWTRGLGKHFDDLIQVVTTGELIDKKFLSPFRVFAPSHPDLSGVSIRRGDYDEGELAEAMNKPELVADVVATWLQRGEDRPTLCFAVDRAHAKQLQAQFLASGVPAGYIDAFTSREERGGIRQQFHAGEIKVVCNVGTMTTGVDWDVRCIILARPTKSEMLFVQIVGRGLRTADGKDDCIILDHSDTTLRLGFVTDICHDELDDGRKTRKLRAKPKAKPLECSKCTFVRPARVHQCPACGFKPERQCAIEQQDGELVAIAKSQRTREEADRKIRVYGMLKHYAKRQGYSEGWASHKYREYFGFWPNAYSWAPQIEPDADVLGWIRSRQIAFARSRRSA